MSGKVLFQNIENLYSFSGMAAKNGVRVDSSDLGRIPDGALLAENGRVAWVGARKDVPASARDAQVLSLDAQTVMPAFVECHTHLAFGGSRAEEFEWRIQGQNYQEIAAKGGGILSTVKATRALDVADLQSLIQKRADEYLRQGVTLLEVKSGYGLNSETELKSLRAAKAIQGPRIVTTFLGAHALPPEFSSRKQYLDYLIDEVLPQVAKERLAERVDIFIENGFFTPEEARRYFEAACRLGLAITAHVEQLSRSGGVQAALAFKPQSLDHVVHVNDEDIEGLRRENVTAVLLPMADFYLKEAYPPARRLIDAGVRVALSTDYNPGTSPSQDLSTIGVLARLQMRMTLAEVLSAWTVGAAHALGRGGEQGALLPGKSCDFVCLDGNIEELFYSIGHHPITAVFRDGQKCYEKRF